MKRWLTELGAILVLTVVLAFAVSSALADSTPKLKLTAAKSSGKVGTSIKFSVVVTANTPPYEVRIYAKTGSTWRKVTTAKLVSAGKYTASVKLTKKGKMRVKAAYLNSSGAVKAYSNIVTIKVK